MPRGGTVSTTWKKGQKPPVQKPKGRKNNKTLLKESLGLNGWDALTKFIEGEGADKLILEMKKLKGKSYITAMHNLSEYVKPKLRRVDANISGDLTLKGSKVTFK
jgi:hypothetical protein